MNKNQNSFLEEYYSKIKSGEIVVGAELKKELEKLIEEKNSGKYLYDIKEGHKRINFIEKELRLHEAPFSGKPFKLILYQKAFIECLFSFFEYKYDLGKYCRRFHKVLFMVGRKNGKSPLMAAITLAEWACGEMGQNVICASNDYNQASIVYNNIDQLRKNSTLRKCTKSLISGIYWTGKNKVKKFSEANSGTIRKMSANTSYKEGRNLSLVIIDEVFEMKDGQLVLPLEQSLSTQENPLMILITTEGFLVNGYLQEELIKARAIINNEINDSQYLPWIYTQDNEEEIFTDENSWTKSNPSLDFIKKREYLRQLLEESKFSSEKRNYVLVKDFNIHKNFGGALKWLQDDISFGEEIFSLEEFAGKYYIAGVDLSISIDLCAISLIFFKNGKKYIYNHYFITGNNDKLEKYKNVTRVNGDYINPSEVADRFYLFYQRYKIKPFKIGYDDRFAKLFIERIENIFGGDILQNIPQLPKYLSPAMDLLENDLRNKKAIIPDDISRENLKNITIKTSNDGLIMPARQNKKEKIDGGVAIIIAYNAIIRFYRDEFFK